MYRAAMIAMAVAAAALPASAQAATIVFSGSMTGTAAPATPPAGCTLRGSALTGTGSSTLGSFAYSHTVCLAGAGPINGNFLFDFSGVDTLFGSIAGSAATTPTTGLFDLSLAYTILGGTGQFDGASGGFLGIGRVDQRTAGVTRVTLNFAPVPEPATWATMLLGFAGIGLTIRRRETQALRPA